MDEHHMNNIKILFICHGNMLRGIPIGLNVYEKKM